MRTFTEKQVKYFYHLAHQLILFTNNRYKIHSGFKTPEDLHINTAKSQKALMSVRDKMYASENIKEFCKNPPHGINKDDLTHISEWKNCLSGKFYIMKHLENFTVFLIDLDGICRLYGVKSLFDDLADTYPNYALPAMVQTILIPFMGCIVYDGLMERYNISFASGIKGDLKEEYNKAKALKGIYSKYKTGDTLSNPSSTTTVKDQVKFYISQSLKNREFPTNALNFANVSNERKIFEHEYTAIYGKGIKKSLKYNADIPPMHYAMYRECVIAVQPDKKALVDFCKKYYSEIFEYISFFKITKSSVCNVA